MFAEIIAIGSELTCGARLDTNSQWLSRELEAIGWTVTRHTALADDLDAIAAELRSAAARSRVIVITGGLGPTLDDLTREAIALAFQQPLVRDLKSLDSIRALFQARGRSMPERNERQADRPRDAIMLPNSCGTAPGVLMEVAGSDGKRCILAAVPGVPAEMKVMFAEEVLPRLPSSGQHVVRRMIRTFGYGESEAERLLGDLTARGRNPEVGITASEAVISLSVTARASSAAEATGLCAAVCGDIQKKLGVSVFATDDIELHVVVAGQLLGARRQVSLIEGTCTGGLLNFWLTETQALESVIGSSERFVRSLTIGHDELLNSGPVDQQSRINWLRHTILNEVAVDRRSCILFSSEFKDDCSSGVDVCRGWVAAILDEQIKVADVSMTGNLAIFRQRAARTALNQLRLLLLEADLART